MMKLTKPISSPGRTLTKTNHHPPPLMKFLRNKSTTSTRKRSSRLSPMFFRKKHTQISNTQQEPSSPKVTCIGQIKHKKHSNKKTQNPNPNCFCQCLRNLKLKPTFFYNVLTKWVSFFRCGCSGNTENTKVSDPESCSDNNVELFSEKNASVSENMVMVIKSPPKNAFLLTRCRSAPYRSNSLASKILCESSVFVEEVKIKKDDEDVNEGVKNGDEELMVIKGVKRIEGIKENEMPLFLTRCKSESGRKWDKFLV